MYEPGSWMCDEVNIYAWTETKGCLLNSGIRSLLVVPWIQSYTKTPRDFSRMSKNESQKGSTAERSRSNRSLRCNICAKRSWRARFKLAHHHDAQCWQICTIIALHFHIIWVYESIAYVKSRTPSVGKSWLYSHLISAINRDQLFAATWQPWWLRFISRSRIAPTMHLTPNAKSNWLTSHRRRSCNNRFL